jgi:hypothetical protein
MVKTFVTLERIQRKTFRVLERRHFPMKSWTQGFFENLYVLHAQTTYAAPQTTVDVDNNARFIDAYQASGATNVRFYGNALRLNSPPGNGANIGDGYIAGNGIWVPYYSLPGCDGGIQVGTGNTAVTPTDRRMVHRIGHGQRAPDGGAVLTEYYNTDDDSQEVAYGVFWVAQMFVPDHDFRLSRVDLKIFKTGAPGDLTVSIRGQSHDDTLTNNYPIDGADLTSGTIAEAAIPAASPGAMTTCNFATPIDVYAGHIYYIVIRALGGGVGNTVSWRIDNTASPHQRAPYSYQIQNTHYVESASSGVAWTANLAKTALFEVYGESQGEFEYGGCEISNIAIANPNGSFDIRRFFYNNSGASIDVEEVGLVVVGNHNYTSGGNIATYLKPILAARDVVAPALTVADTEILLVTYTVGITV